MFSNPKAYADRNFASKGFTLVEIMVGLVIITVAFVSLASVFTNINRGIFTNKTKTLATNLAQEKIESLKNFSYYRLLVTTATTTDSNFPGMIYDQGTTQSYYPEEDLNVGGIRFRRRVLVEFMKQDGNALVSQPWTVNDTGIKQVTVYVVWSENDEWKKVELVNLQNNPNRANLDYTFTGKITSGTTGNVLENVLVETVQNFAYSARTDSGGNYSFKVQPGTYALRATLDGYFTATSTNYIVAADDTGSSKHNFQLTLMAQGSATGYAYIQNHLVISQVVTDYDTDQDNQEWVELYNPTTYNILIASRTDSSSQWSIFFTSISWIDDDNNEPSSAGNKGKYLLGLPAADGSVFTTFRSTSIHWTVNTTSISIPSRHFFLIANYSTIIVGGTPIIADAYYTGTQTDNSQIDDGSAGGIRVTGAGGLSFNDRTDWHDGVGWMGGGVPSKAYETTPYSFNPGNGDMLLRTDLIGARNRTTNPPAGNCFDTNNSAPSSSNGNWVENTVAAFIAASTNTRPMNADQSMLPGPCTPAVGASVTASDGLSSAAYVQALGSFTIVGMATGTWTVTISSGNFTREISTVTITQNIGTGIPNNSTVPRWEFSGLPSIALTTSTIYGYISGRVVGASGSGLSGVSVSANGFSAVTDSQGRYRISLTPPASPTSVTASKDSYSTEIVQNVSVSLGIDTAGVDFTLVSAGSIKGFVTTNGVASGKLPGVPVIATDLSSSTIIGSAISDANGNFTIPSIVTGTYIVSPQLEDGESSSPGSKTITVISNSTGTWSSTFTVTNAFGEIRGMVEIGSSVSPITTGVLVIASTQPITSENPPTFNSTLRSGTTIYYAVSSDAGGNYALSLRGNASYYLYGWYPTTLSVSSSSAPKRAVSGTVYVGPGATATKNITW